MRRAEFGKNHRWEMIFLCAAEELYVRAREDTWTNMCTGVKSDFCIWDLSSCVFVCVAQVHQFQVTDAR